MSSSSSFKQIAVLETTHMGNRSAIYQQYAARFLLRPLMETLAEEGFEATRIRTDTFPVSQVKQLVSHYDGFIIIGGEDINPQFYNGLNGYFSEEKHYDTSDINQLAIIKEVIVQGKKLLGICRGLQIMNIAFGGNLIQHFDNGNHRRLPLELDVNFIGIHPVNFTENTQLERIYSSNLSVASGHHQAVNKLGEGFVVAATAPDGIIEAIEHENGLLVGVQFHPEHKLFSDDQLKPFLSLLR